MVPCDVTHFGRWYQKMGGTCSRFFMVPLNMEGDLLLRNVLDYQTR
jgi:hypothetical protein